MRYLVKLIAFGMFLPAILISCGRSDTSGHQNESIPVNLSSTPQESANLNDPATLCKRIGDIKILPEKGERGEDPIYDALMDAGDRVVPCLIERVSDTAKTRDPRQEPGYPDIEVRIGDIAYFLIVDITKLDFVKLLPSEVQRQYRSDGVYAYFKYVQRDENRKTLQRKLRDWYEKR